MRIHLEIRTKLEFEYLTKGVSLRLIRLVTTVQLESEDGWTMWSAARVRWLMPEEVKPFGIGTREKEGVSVKRDVHN